jgi:hypothetical protein
VPCKLRITQFLHGKGVKLSEDIIPHVSKQPEVMEAAVEAGKTLGQRLKQGHDRAQVTERMQTIMIEKFEGSA